MSQDPAKAVPTQQHATTKRQEQRPRLTIADLEACGRALTVADLEQVFSVHKLTIYKMVREGRIPGAFRIGTCVRFDPRKVAAAFLEAK